MLQSNRAAPRGPRRFSVPVFTTPPDLVAAGTWPVVASPDFNKFYSGAIFNSSHAQNDGAAWWTPDFSVGTWRLDLLCGINTFSAIATIDISFDSGSNWTSLGTLDTYTSGASAGAIKSLTGLSITQDGPALVRFRALTKNASSTDWYLVLTSMEWTRTA